MTVSEAVLERAEAASRLHTTSRQANVRAVVAATLNQLREELESNKANTAASLALSDALPPSMRFDTSKAAPFADRQGIALKIVEAAVDSVLGNKEEGQ